MRVANPVASAARPMVPCVKAHDLQGKVGVGSLFGMQRGPAASCLGRTSERLRSRGLAGYVGLMGLLGLIWVIWGSWGVLGLMGLLGV